MAKQRKSSTVDGAERIITEKELQDHVTAESLWIVVNGKVYDVTEFADEHPGGPDALLDVAGRDGTAEFDDIGHSTTAINDMKQYEIGRFEGGSSSGSSGSSGGGKKDDGSALGGGLLVPLVIVAVVIGVYLILQSGEE